MLLLVTAAVRGRHRPAGHGSDAISPASPLCLMVPDHPHAPDPDRSRRATTLPIRNIKSCVLQTLRVAAAAAAQLAVGACATVGATDATPSGTAGGAATAHAPVVSGGGAAATQVPVTLVIGTPVRLDDGTTVTLRDVTDDTRCPSDATCLWAGDATLTIAVTPPHGTTEVVILHTGLADAQSATVAGRRLTLERLEPLPTTARPVERPQYRAFFAIST